MRRNRGQLTPQDLTRKSRTMTLTLAEAAAAGGAAVAFLVLTKLVFQHTIVRCATLELPWFALTSLGVITATSLVSGWLMSSFCPEAAGSGIPQLKKAFWMDLGHVPFRAVWVKFIAGVLAVGGGASLGREGPTVFVGGGTASAMAGTFGVVKQGRRPAAAAGAAAGLAAAFNTPLAAIAFVLEEIIGNLNSRLLGSAVLASVMGAFAVYATLGRQPAFELPTVGAVAWRTYLAAPVVALPAALVGQLFQHQTLRLQGNTRNLVRVPPWMRPVIGGWITWVLGAAVFAGTGRLGVFGLGYGDLSLALAGKMTWGIAGLLLATKLVATISAYGWGGCGGIFAPTLFLGGMTGLMLGGAAQHWLGLSSPDLVVLAATGMTACLGSVVRAPLTSLLIVFEMTHQFSMVPALMLGMIVSQAVARTWSRHNFYDAALRQEGHEMMRISPPRDLESWQNLPVSAIANMKPVVVRDLSGPAMAGLLRRYPYRLFPVEREGRFAGLLSREAMQTAVAAEREPVVGEGATASPDTTVREVADRMVHSSYGMLVIVDDRDRAVRGLVTLHDLLRAQVAVRESEE